jgi:hypothetical protein
VIDQFFVSQASSFWGRIVTWAAQGTSRCSLGEQVLPDAHG